MLLALTNTQFNHLLCEDLTLLSVTGTKRLCSRI